MNTSKLETTDIFKGAFFLSVGGDLSTIEFKTNGKQTATFMFTGPDLHKHDKNYRNGHALVNPVQFREALNHLRDVLFEKMRKNNKPEMRYDRSRNHRYHQKYC